MRRFYIKKKISEEDQVELSPSDALHIAKVLRLKPGLEILLIDGSGEKYLADLVLVDRKSTVVRILSRYQENNEPSLQIIVATAILKEKKMDKVLRQLTELGITEWYPFYSDRSVPLLDVKKCTSKMSRWKKITIESLKQCERNMVPVIHEPLIFDDLVREACQFQCKLLFHERTQGTLDSISIPENDKKVFLVFGPEGGFSEQESETFSDYGFLFVSMGPRILRAETAITSGTAIIQHRFGDLN